MPPRHESTHQCDRFQADARAQCGCTARSLGQLGLYLPVFGVALFPKCPLCVAAIVGLLGSVGLAFDAASLKASLMMLLVVSLAASGLLALRRRRPVPCVLAIVGVSVAMWGRYADGPGALLYMGLAIVIAAAMLAAQPWVKRAPASKLADETGA